MTDAVERQAAFSRECALIAAKAADEKKATDIMVQEVCDLIGVTDYFVIATAANSRQVDAIIDEIEDKLRELFLEVYAYWVQLIMERRHPIYSKTTEIWNSYMPEQEVYRAEANPDPIPYGRP